MQMTMPKRRSLWPSMPRKVTWDRSGSFKFASPPASAAKADAAPSSVSTAAAALNLANLQLRDQAFASQVSIQNPPLVHRSQAFTRQWLPGQRFPAHFFSRALLGATEKRVVHILSGRGSRAPVREYPQTGLMKHPQDGGSKAAQNADL